VIIPGSTASARSAPDASPPADNRSGEPSAASAAAGALTQLPLRATFPNLPAIPVDPAGILDTLAKLSVRVQQEAQAKQGLTRKFTIGGVTRTAYEFLYAGTAPSALSDPRPQLATLIERDPERASSLIGRSLGSRSEPAASASGALSLEQPAHFSISWTTFPDVYASGLASLPAWSASLTDAGVATSQFWPMIAQHGFGFNLILPERVTGAKAPSMRRMFGDGWTRRVAAAQAAGNLYVIDMSRFAALSPNIVNGASRFTPGTVTLLIRDPRTKTLAPVAILVSGQGGRGRRLFARTTATDGAWLYALQAAKASITVYGIWLGHVYQWHIVTAAMQMTMLNTLAPSHPLYKLLAPQSKYAIPFDDVLLLLWAQVAPPTSVSSGQQFLGLCNAFAAGRSYFDDDPRATLTRLGLRQADFSVRQPWDQYPVVRRLLAVWELVEAYVRACARATYRSDAAVAGDGNLQTWISTAGSSAATGGNVRGLPRMNSRAALERVLTSFLYRITVHGISSLPTTSSPALTFMANFPHCLQRTDIPNPRARLSTKALLSYLPNTDAISQAVTFYFTFAFSPPYEQFIPLAGVDTGLFFPGGTGDPRNRALIDLRNGLAAFIDDYQPDKSGRFQWPLNVEL
jgi:Lipoxygenase